MLKTVPSFIESALAWLELHYPLTPRLQDPTELARAYQRDQENQAGCEVRQ